MLSAHSVFAFVYILTTYAAAESDGIITFLESGISFKTNGNGGGASLEGFRSVTLQYTLKHSLNDTWFDSGVTTFEPKVEGDPLAEVLSLLCVGDEATIDIPQDVSFTLPRTGLTLQVEIISRDPEKKGAYFDEVTVGEYHICGRVQDSQSGSWVCWGDCEYGNCEVPHPSKYLFSKLSAGAKNTCGIYDDGKIKCWGDNEFGQSSPPVGIDDFVDVVAGRYFSCGVRDGGKMECWGHLPHANEDMAWEQTIASHIEDFEEISIYGIGVCGLRKTGQIECPEHKNLYTEPTKGRSFTRISVGYNHVCVINKSGKLGCFGCKFDNARQCRVPHLNSKVIDVSAGYRTTCALTEDLKATCWGSNEDGQYLDTKEKFSAVYTETSFSCGLLHEGGKLVCSGDFYGKLNPEVGYFSYRAVPEKAHREL